MLNVYHISVNKCEFYTNRLFVNILATSNNP